jgi:hypothetical protein
MRLDASGNVGIGTTDTTYGKVVVNSAGSAATNTSIGITPSHLYLNDSSAVPTGQAVNIDFGYSGGGSASSTARIGAINNTAVGTQLYFSTSANYGAMPVERMRIDESGNLLVNATSVGSVQAGSVSATVIEGTGGGILKSRDNTGTRSQIAFYNPNGLVGQITTSGTATAYATSSDQRLKENIIDAPAGNIDSLKVRSFDWKADGSHQEYGFIAQELDEVAPYAVSKGETKDDIWGVDYSKLVPMLVKEIQDLKAEVAALKGA